MSDRLRDVASGRAGRPGGVNWLAGRANRLEFWIWVVCDFVAMVALSMFKVPGVAIAGGVLITLITVRRLHDLGHSGWVAPVINVAVNVLSFGLIVLLGATTGGIGTLLLQLVVIAVLGALPGQPVDNAWGPPRGRARRQADLRATFG